MKYVLLVYANESTFTRMSPDEHQEAVSAYMAYTEALKNAKVYVASQRLQPVATATTVRVSAGKAQVHDGPFADTREQFGGFYMIDVPDLDGAIAWATRCPGATHGSMEVRPVWGG